jgi:hypothetical protein
MTRAKRRAWVSALLVALPSVSSAQPTLNCQQIAERPRQFITPEALAYCHLQNPPPTPLAPPPPKYGTAKITNKSCRTIKHISIDGVDFNKQIDPGGSDEFKTSMESVWNSTIICHGEPYPSYSWIVSKLVSNNAALPDESLVTENTHMGIYSDISITSKLDCIAIDKIVANRGNCRSPEQDVFILKFGQTVKFLALCEKLLELEISTDQGIGIFKFYP